MMGKINELGRDIRQKKKGMIEIGKCRALMGS